MTIPTFPTLPGLTYPVRRSPNFQTLEHVSVSGVSTTQSPQAFARYEIELPFSFLRSGNEAEYQALMGLFLACRGRGGVFHFNDPDDNAVTDQLLGTGDGTTRDFGLVRDLGIATDPVQNAIEAGLSVTVNGSLMSFGTDYALLRTSQFQTVYGIHLAVAPAIGEAVRATFSYNWLCRFAEDSSDFRKIWYRMWDNGAVKIQTVLQ